MIVWAELPLPIVLSTVTSITLPIASSKRSAKSKRPESDFRGTKGTEAASDSVVPSVS